MKIYELEARFDARKSFYGKAHVIDYENGTFELLSYVTYKNSVNFTNFKFSLKFLNSAVPGETAEFGFGKLRQNTSPLLYRILISTTLLLRMMFNAPFISALKVFPPAVL